MSLFRGAMRPPAILSDQAIERYLAAIRAELEPDPLFRRRLRGQVMNRFVASREGMIAAPPRRTMGRLGRSVLYASFALAATTTSVLAASQEALPGDLLYPLKREVEQLRVQVLPAHLQDDLAAYALGERIEELGALAERGDDAPVAALAAIVERDYEAFLEMSLATPGGNEHHLIVLTGLLDSLPEPAQAAIASVIERLSGSQQDYVLGQLLERFPQPAQAADEVLKRPTGPRAPADDAAGERADGPPNGTTGGSIPAEADESEPAVAPEPTGAPEPTASPEPDDTQKPSRGQRPDPAPRDGGHAAPGRPDNGR